LKEEAKNKRIELVENYEELYTKVSEFVQTLSKEPNLHIYYQVLPLGEIPSKGRGSASDVKVGKWLWADIDYKEEVEKAEFEGCKELKDHALKCYYREGDKIIRVERPPLSEILNTLRKYNLEPTLIIDSGAGYHLYFELESEIDAKELKTLENNLVDFLRTKGIKVDEKAKDLARILRLVGTVNPRTNRLVQVIYQSEKVYSKEELEKMLNVERPKNNNKENKDNRGFRTLSDLQLDKIKELIKPGYRKGYRNQLCLFLTGWFAKARIHPLQVVKIIKALHDETNDEEKLYERCNPIVYSYSKEGLDITPFIDEIEKICCEDKEKSNCKLSGKDKEHEGPVKGATGIQEILEETVGENKALSIIKEIQEILKTASPHLDSVFEIMDYDKHLFAVANPRKKVVVRAQFVNGEYKEREVIVEACPILVEVYENPIGGITKYRTIWVSNVRNKEIEIGPAMADEIVDYLRAEGLVKHKELAYNYVPALLIGYIKKGKAVEKNELESPGFYLLNGKIEPSRVEIRKPTTEELKEALLLLNDLAEKWFSHIKDKFAMIVRWAVISPFGYVYKQRGQWIKWLYLYGTSKTGKTTLAEIILKIWGLDSKYMKSGSNIDTIARLGYVLSQGTYPVVINEPGDVLKANSPLIDPIKHAIEQKTVRGAYRHGNYIEYPALAMLVFTTNKTRPNDDALLRRLIVMHFVEQLAEERIKEFDKNIRPQLNKLKVIGDFIAYTVVNNNDLLQPEWESAATKLLEMAYREVGLEVPQWIYEKYEIDENDIYEDNKQRVREFLLNVFITAYHKNVAKSTGVETLREIVARVLRENLIPWANFVPKNGYNEVRFTIGLADELSAKIGDISLRQLAKLLGWEYKNIKIMGSTVKAIVVSEEELYKFLFPQYEDES